MTVETESTLPNRASDAVSPPQPGAPIPIQQTYTQPLPANPVVQVPSSQPIVQPIDSYHVPPYSLNGSSHNVLFGEVIPRRIVDCRGTKTFFRRSFQIF